MEFMSLAQLLGNVGEFFGAIGVIATLFYLAAQIRANSRSTQLQNTQTLSAATRAWWNDIARDPELTSLFRRGLADFDQLTLDEQLRFSCTVLQWVTIAEELHFAELDGEITGYAGQAYSGGGLEEFATAPGFHTWYEIRKQFITPEFQAVIEAAMAKDTQRAAWFTEAEQSA